MRIFAGVPWGSASNDTGVVVVATVIFSVFAGYFFRNFRGKARVIIYPLLKKYHAVPYKKYHGILGRYFLPWYYHVPRYWYHGTTVKSTAPKYHGTSYHPRVPWYCTTVYHGNTMIVPWYTMVLPWYYHGIFLAGPTRSPLSAFSVFPKCMTLSDLEWLFRLKFCSFLAGLSDFRPLERRHQTFKRQWGCVLTHVLLWHVSWHSLTLFAVCVKNRLIHWT